MTKIIKILRAKLQYNFLGVNFKFLNWIQPHNCIEVKEIEVAKKEKANIMIYYFEFVMSAAGPNSWPVW